MYLYALYVSNVIIKWRKSIIKKKKTKTKKMYLINSLIFTLKPTPLYCFIHTKTKLCVQQRWNQGEINFAHLCYILCFINIVYKG